MFWPIFSQVACLASVFLLAWWTEADKEETVALVAAYLFLDALFFFVMVMSR